MNKCGYWLCSIAVVALLGGLPRPAHAGKSFNYTMGAACQAAGLVSAVSPLTYTNSGFMIQGLTSVDVICPISWAKAAVPTGLIVGELDVEVDWILPGGVPAPINACSLSYQSLGGSLTMQALPIPYPVPANMVSMAYGAVVCTVPPWVGIQGIAFNMCVTTPTSPATCPAP
jgi:hypothetical protein